MVTIFLEQLLHTNGNFFSLQMYRINLLQSVLHIWPPESLKIEHLYLLAQTSLFLRLFLIIKLRFISL